MFAQPLENHMRTQKLLKAVDRPKPLDEQQSPDTTVEDSDANDMKTDLPVRKDENVDYSPQRQDDKQAAEERRANLLQRIRKDDHTDLNKLEKLVFQPLFKRLPPKLGVSDTRFAASKKDRRFYCDGCGRAVCQLID